MDPNSTHQQVWIFIGESDQWHGQPLYMAILDALRHAGISGATVLRGLAGYGANGRVHTASLVELSADLPIAITFVDRADRVARNLPAIADMVGEGLITTMPVTVVKQAPRLAGPFPPDLVVADVMRREIATVRPDTPVAEIVTLLIDRGVRAVPVADAEGRVAGVITDGDLLRRGQIDLPVPLQQVLPPAERAAATAGLAEHPHVAADLMTPHPHTLPQGATLAHAAQQLVAHNLKRIPVVDAAGRLAGMVSRGDLLGTLAAGAGPHDELELATGSPQTVAGVMLREVPTVRPDTPLAEVIERLHASARQRVVVVDASGRVAGIITDGDVLRRAARGARGQGALLRRLAHWLGRGDRPDEIELAVRGHTAADVMTSPALTLRDDTPIGAAIRELIAAGLKRMPVVDADGRLVGLVGRAGLLRALATQLNSS
jgi:CBS-domain-containing membrane protein